MLKIEIKISENDNKLNLELINPKSLEKATQNEIDLAKLVSSKISNELANLKLEN